MDTESNLFELADIVAGKLKNSGDERREAGETAMYVTPSIFFVSRGELHLSRSTFSFIFQISRQSRW